MIIKIKKLKYGNGKWIINIVLCTIIQRVTDNMCITLNQLWPNFLKFADIACGIPVIDYEYLNTDITHLNTQHECGGGKGTMFP